jgi:hypothetical protein
VVEIIDLDITNNNVQPGTTLLQHLFKLYKLNYAPIGYPHQNDDNIMTLMDEQGPSVTIQLLPEQYLVQIQENPNGSFAFRPNTN